jgi:hypothetical protein
MDDLDDHLAGLDAFQNFSADSLFTHLVGERANDFQRDVGFQERTANLAQGRRHIGFRQRATAGQSIQD